MKRFHLSLIILSFVLPSIVNAEEISLSLDEAITIALENNRDVLLQIEDVKKSKEKIAESKATLLPTLDFTASRTRNIGLYSKDVNQTTEQLTLKQYLYKGGSTINTIDSNKYKLEVSQAKLDKAKLEMALKVKKAFYTLLLANEFADLNKAIAENTEAHLRLVEVRYQNGQSSELEVFNLKRSLENVEKAYTESLNQIESSQSLVRNLLYLDNSIEIKPEGELAYEEKEMDFEKGLLEAMRNRPEIRQYEAQEKSDKKEIEITKADARPNIYASWDYYNRSHISAGAATAKGWTDYSVVGVTISWPIFDGWETKSKLEQAIIDLKETQLEKEKIIKDISLELKNAYVSLKNAIAKVKAIESEMSFYDSNLSSIKEKYKNGIASALDLGDAALSREVSIFNTKEAVYNYIIAAVDFAKATGGV